MSNKKGRKKVILIVLVIVVFVVWIYWGNQKIETTTYEVRSSNITETLNGFTIVQVSDLHNKTFGDNQCKLISKMKDIKPDIIAITGDLIDSNHTDVDVAMDFIEEAIKIAPIYYITGNHEAWSEEYKDLRQRLTRTGVNMMDDKVAKVSYHGEQICLLGIADPSFNEEVLYTGGNEEVVNKELKILSYDRNSYTILLSHRPELFQVYVGNEVNLVLTGHAHGGQFRIPFVGGLVAPDQGLFPKYTSGIFVDGSTNMIVSRGLGNSIIPFRINNRPELVVVKLKNK